MDLTYEEIDILRVYISQSQTATIHNLTVAASYFKESPQSILFSMLLHKIRVMEAAEFHKLKSFIFEK